MSASPKADNLPLPPMPTQKFGVMSLDPPWHFRSRATVSNPESDRSPQRHYPTMDLSHLAAMPIREMAKPDAFVFLWITGPLLAQGVHNLLFKAWGVKASSTAFVWIKLWNEFDPKTLLRTPLLENDIAMGTGFTTRQNAEYVILGRIGSPSRARGDIRQVIISPRREHSRKPEEYYRRVEHYTAAGPRLDMFAGAERPGWTSYGWSHREDERTESAVQRTGKRAECKKCTIVGAVNDTGLCLALCARDELASRLAFDFRQGGVEPDGSIWVSHDRRLGSGVLQIHRDDLFIAQHFGWEDTGANAGEYVHVSRQ